MSSDSEESTNETLQDEPEDAESELSKTGKVKPKKRTKTGCLTCRKRRIKCGEERPICKNCIKSKRECAGYKPLSSSNKPIDPSPSHATQGIPSYHLNSQYPTSLPASFGVPYNTFQPQISNVNSFEAWSGVTPSSAFGTHQYPLNYGQTPAETVSSAWSTPVLGLNSQAPDQTSAEYQQSTPFHNVSSTSNIPSYNAFTTRTRQDAPGNHIANPESVQFRTHQDVDGFGSNSTPYMPGQTTGLRAATGWHTFPKQPEGPRQELAAASLYDQMQSRGFVTRNSALEENITGLRSVFPSSPLLDEQCHTIFRHFLDVTAPCMSIFDRLESAEVPAAQTMVWTSGLPKIALRHPALAHAILAIGAVHLSRLNGSSDDVAIEHFTSALQKVKVLLESKTTRSHVATLATILLLAYYEVITGDHARWSLHISGAARLVMENDFANTIRKIQQMRTQAQLRIAIHNSQQPQMNVKEMISVAGIPQILLDDQDWNVDQDLVSFFMGMPINYAVQQQPNFENRSTVPELGEKEAEEFRILMEMYWWYCKQDLFQSMLSGDAPMLSYSKWRFCPPRGQFGLVDKPHATVDHLWLILARIMDFGFRDRKRKLRVISANSGAYCPPPGFLPQPPTQSKAPHMAGDGGSTLPQNHPNINPPDLSRSKGPPIANESRMRTSKASSVTMQAPAGVPMYGMLPPPTSPVRMSSLFQEMEAELHGTANFSPLSSGSAGSSDQELDLQEAMKEHDLILEALDKFDATIPAGFRPVSTNTVISTPFGPAQIYRSATIATMWTFYYVARIILRRLHPHSHPAAMISAGINAAVTAQDAQVIGRIFAGLCAQYDELLSTGRMDHIMTAALVESSFSLLFAAVQYQAPPQRSWTISRLKSLAQQTGWASCISIASACEATWFKMGEAGKGLPYVRTLVDPENDDARLAPGSSTNNPLKSAVDAESGVVKEHELRFVQHDRNLISRHTSTRAYWALGLLCVEEDLKLMSLNDEK